ncbi:MAG: DUF3048 domain-containing protein [Clostridia bacterium]|nr:DUF3048 domain-containing protein [Clostridia bacterium]
MVIKRALAAFLAAGSLILSSCAISTSSALTAQATHIISHAGTTTPAAATAAAVESEPTPEPESVSPTTGLAGAASTYRPIIVQIENEPPARPQSGLQWADVVYETLIEADATRFTCLFNDILYAEDSPETLEVGPVRSSRYYHQWIQGPWDALYVHMGGAETPGRQSYIWGESSEHIQQRINGAGKYPSNAELEYRRKGTGKALEHTAYTELHADAEIMSYQPVQYQTFQFSEEDAYADQPVIDNITLSFWGPSNFVEYRYDEQKNKLIRYMGGKEFLAEETGEPVEIQNLVVQYTNVSELPGEGGRKQVDMFGTGEADFIINGHHISGTWERQEGAHTQTVYRDEQGREIVFAPGNTWIAVHPDNRETVITDETGESVRNERPDLH